MQNNVPTSTAPRKLRFHEKPSDICTSNSARCLPSVCVEDYNRLCTQICTIYDAVPSSPPFGVVGVGRYATPNLKSIPTPVWECVRVAKTLRTNSNPMHFD